jgi:hypothetical protein
MANDITPATGRETAAALNTITTGIAIDTATSASTIDMTSDMVIMIIAGMTDNARVARAAG